MGKKIFVIDDDLITLDLIRLMFQRTAIEVIPATHHINILQLAHEVKPDLILIDLWLPHLNPSGLELAKQIKQDPFLGKIPIIVITAGDSGFGDENRAFEAGCDGYVRKPFHPKELREYLHQFLPVDLG